ncbi:hypothetical protein U1E44_16550 [Arenibacter sp. GZD96]|uniref:hypothetical protein n=1 Tax=Aurantibrevibacter litoralis TaxID=3106030 RepID=UPI002AFE5924|nr:hypothetical protein [Arenibacter sp. GZD-96]MEA1787714.1 hypothetical protein [Arenibacter sp. GZD-96]
MKSKIKLSAFTLICFTLMSCPAGHFHDYKYLGVELKNEQNSSTRIEFNEKTDLYLRVGYYIQFIDEKQNGLSAEIEANPNFDGNLNDSIKEIKSSTFGKLNRTNNIYGANQNFDLKNTILYNLTFNHYNETKTLKKIKNDTISIEFTNGKKLVFIRKSE